ncbi:MAG: hypothetical protein WBL61_04180 [Bryobacteraceae bacterium]
MDEVPLLCDVFTEPELWDALLELWDALAPPLADLAGAALAGAALAGAAALGLSA